jgi:alkylated DNA repair dioxygenase AlkB
LGEKSSPKEKWHGDQAFEYTYSNINKYALPWTKELLELKVLVESLTGELFNSCLLNLYHTGEEGMAWHSDDETDLKRDGAIASLSFGQKENLRLNINIAKKKSSCT